MSGCATTSIPTKQSSSLPTISNLKTISDMTEIGFEWSATNDERVIGYELYRLDPTKQIFKPIAQIRDRFATHYVDTNLQPSTTYMYHMKTYSQDEISKDGEKVSVATRPLIESVPFVKAIPGLPNRVKLIWRPHPDSGVVGYIIKRADAGSDSFTQIDEIKGRLNAEYIDINVKPGRSYKYLVYVKTGTGVISKPTEVIKATTKELPPPVTNASATQNRPKKIVLSWQPPVVKDFSHYNVYRSVSKFLPYTYLVKTTSTSYEDLINSNGATRYYKITAVDIDGLESLKLGEPIVGSTLEAPIAPKIISAKYNENKVFISWRAVDRAIYYTIYKSGGGYDKVISDIRSTSYDDFDIQPDLKYSYKVVAVDEFGLNSEKSDSIEVSTK